MENERLVDLSHVVEDGMITYMGLPAPIVCDFLSREQSRAIYAQGTEFHIGRIDMVSTAPGSRSSSTGAGCRSFRAKVSDSRRCR